MGVEPPAERSRDHIAILSGTTQNVVGIGIAAVATFVANILISNVLGTEGFGVVTLLTQGAFVLSFATRAGMDMAVLRDVAIETGRGRQDRLRVPVGRATAIALSVSTLVAALGIVFADPIRAAFSIDAGDEGVVEAACVGLPFLALANVWLSATRGLKIMRYTLYVFWAGQPVAWIVLMVGGWLVSKSEWMSILAYSLSWALAAAAAWWFWRRESRNWPAAPMEQGDLSRLVRYAGPRAPAALFSQLLFWTDLFVLTQFAAEADVGIYSAALRAGQVLVLFLTSVSLMFSPFVADLHARGESERLDRLFKSLTKWTLAATVPLFVVLFVAPQEALRLFGSDFTGGKTALVILLAGQLVNVATGSVGFVLIMVGRTGWDLAVYAVSLVMNLGLAFWLCPEYGIEGAAVANAATFALSKWARLVLVRRFVSIQPYDRSYLRLVVPAGVGLAAAVATHEFFSEAWLAGLLATGVACTAAFGIAYFAVGLTAAERRGLSGLKSRLQAG
jgi:O-antigen/teichoic acid export membrane protein